ncbi:MAG: serine hydroxymethyltransferase [Candidatus Micrarchaeota archaeon]|nr:serine hydroxymethyltransferase [Candidatus Micrarchaeota archaeon]MDE1847813.1 serine hydroxymethyltransferase [Candidatus Micrarchaeota archaeon]MDE1864381.1 serine hydroxymethyltransferase [Candidatus Micrarchaeota archaeon]
MGGFKTLKSKDPEIFNAINKELRRQRETLEMIPSENFASWDVILPLGTWLTNKYSEGYSGKRYYGGNENIDAIENIAIERARKLFNVPHVNVQPYSGSPANFAVYAALCKPGEVIMGQNLTDGGHLTHGWKTSVTGEFFRSVPYHVKPDGYIDIDEVRRLAVENRPKLIWVGASAYVREFPFEEMAKVADEVGAYLVADIAHIAGLVAGGAHKSPVDYAHIVTTTTHKTLRGPRGAMIMVTEKGLRKDPDLADKIDKAVFPGLQGGPHDNTTAAIAVALLEASQPQFREYAAQVVKNSRALGESLKRRGLHLVTGGTDNHMVLVDLTAYGKGMGIFAQEALDLVGIVVNRNTIPAEPSSPFYPSGIRIGTPAITTRGMKEPEMEAIGNMIGDVVDQVKDYSIGKDREERTAEINRFRREVVSNAKVQEVRTQVIELCSRFPLYEGIEM